jgi:hypothetical protein
VKIIFFKANKSLHFIKKGIFLFKIKKIETIMRELTVQVSDNQFDLLVNFLRTLPYVQLPASFRKTENNGKLLENPEPTPPVVGLDFDISTLGKMSNEPFDIEDIKKNYSIKWENFHEVIALFKDIPLENHIEEHTILHIQ